MRLFWSHLVHYSICSSVSSNSSNRFNFLHVLPFLHSQIIHSSSLILYAWAIIPFQLPPFLPLQEVRVNSKLYSRRKIVIALRLTDIDSDKLLYHQQASAFMPSSTPPWPLRIRCAYFFTRTKLSLSLSLPLSDFRLIWYRKVDREQSWLSWAWRQRRYGVVVVLAASAHRRVMKTKDVWRDAVDEDDDVMRLMIIQLRFRFRFFFVLV